MFYAQFLLFLCLSCSGFIFILKVSDDIEQNRASSLDTLNPTPPRKQRRNLTNWRKSRSCRTQPTVPTLRHPITASFDQWSTFCVVADSSHLIKLRKRARSSSIRSRQNGTSIKSGCLQIGGKRLLKTMAFILKSSCYCF